MESNLDIANRLYIPGVKFYSGQVKTHIHTITNEHYKIYYFKDDILLEFMVTDGAISTLYYEYIFKDNIWLDIIDIDKIQILEF